MTTKDTRPYNPSQVKKVISVLAIGVPIGEHKAYQKTMPVVKKYLRQKISFKDCYYTTKEESKLKLLLVDLEKVEKEKFQDFLARLNTHNILYHLPDNSAKDLEEYLAKLPESRALTLSDITKPGAYRLTLNYENLDFEEVLKLLLPEDVVPISSFSVMGHLVHFNLNENAIPYKETIGHVALDKIPNVKTVVNKATSINTEFRTFQLDLMAGEDNYITCVKENNISLHFDFSKVYWNSRLGTEHSRIVEEVHNLILKNGHFRPVVFDACCGIGPFAIPLAKLLHVDQVYANDLNPDSVYWMEKNIKANSTKKKPIQNLSVFNLDAREFLRKMILEESIKYSEKHHENGQKTVFYILMNLPATAIEFFDVFPSIVNSLPEDFLTFFQKYTFNIRCYTFVRTSPEKDETLKEKICRILSLNESNFEQVVKSFSTQFVRNVAPFKDMHRINAELNLWDLKECLSSKEQEPVAFKKRKCNLD